MRSSRWRSASSRASRCAVEVGSPACRARSTRRVPTVRERHEDGGDLGGDRPTRLRRVARHRTPFVDPRPPTGPGPPDRKHRRAPDAGRNVDAHVCSRSSEAEPARTLAAWPPSPRCPSGTASTRSGCARPPTGRGRRCATTSSSGCPGVARRAHRRACCASGRIVGRRRPARAGRPVRPRHVPLVPPRPARRGAGAVRRSTSCTATTTCSWSTSRTSWPRSRAAATSSRPRWCGCAASSTCPSCQPAHRLDRVTAGLLMFVVRRERRGAYQTLFRDRRVRKTYEAVAPHDPELKLPAHGAQPDRQGARGHPRPRGARAGERRDARRAARAPRRAGPLPAHPAHRPHPPAAAAHERARRADPRRRLLPRPVHRRHRARRLHPPAAAARRAPSSSPTRPPARAAVRQPPHPAGVDRPGRLGRRPAARRLPTSRSSAGRGPPRRIRGGARRISGPRRGGQRQPAAAPRPRPRTPRRAAAPAARGATVTPAVRPRPELCDGAVSAAGRG